MVSDKLKKIIFKHLYHKLSQVEIIPYDNSIFFIDRENRYWYFEYNKNGVLWWRNDFFRDFFIVFDMDLKDYRNILIEWVEEILNCKVVVTPIVQRDKTILIDKVLASICESHKSTHRVQDVFKFYVYTLTCLNFYTNF